MPIMRVFPYAIFFFAAGALVATLALRAEISPLAQSKVIQLAPESAIETDDADQTLYEKMMAERLGRAGQAPISDTSPSQASGVQTSLSAPSTSKNFCADRFWTDCPAATEFVCPDDGEPFCGVRIYPSATYNTVRSAQVNAPNPAPAQTPVVVKTIYQPPAKPAPPRIQWQ